MKVNELLERKEFTVKFTLARHSREQHFTHKTIGKCKALTPAEIKRALKLDVGGSLNTSFRDETGRTMIHLTRTK